MNFNFINASNVDIILKSENSTYIIVAQSSRFINYDINDINIQLLPSGNSYLKKVGKTVIGYHLYVESSYNVKGYNDNSCITLNVVGVEGDHYEYYLHVVPSSSTAKINLQEHTVPDKQEIITSVVNSYNQKQDRNIKNRKNQKKHNFLSEIFLDTIYSVFPILVLFRFYIHNYISKLTMILLMFIIWIFIILLMQLIYKLYDKTIKKFKKNQNKSNEKPFNIISIFESKYIDSITSDTQRYQNKK